jgi:hypothetical protein
MWRNTAVSCASALLRARDTMTCFAARSNRGFFSPEEAADGEAAAAAAFHRARADVPPHEEVVPLHRGHVVHNLVFVVQ